MFCLFWGVLFVFISLGVLRNIAPKFGENILLYGFTIQNYGIYDLFTKSGCFVYIISTEMDRNHIKNKICHSQKLFKQYCKKRYYSYKVYSNQRCYGRGKC